MVEFCTYSECNTLHQGATREPPGSHQEATREPPGSHLGGLWLPRKVAYRKVASSRPVYYSILKLFGHRSQYIIIKFHLHKPSGKVKTCYQPRQATVRDFRVCGLNFHFSGFRKKRGFQEPEFFF